MTDVQSRNLEHYDSYAVKYDSHQYAEELTSKSAAAVLDAYKAVNPNHQEARALEFGIGTGLVAVKIAPSVHSILGIDISAEMLDQVHKKAHNPKYATVASKIQTLQHSVQADNPLPASYPHRSRDLASSEGGGFDLVYSNQVIHHLANAPEAIHTLVQHFVKPGTGWFFIVDNEYDGEGMREYFHKVAREVFDVKDDDKGHGHDHHREGSNDKGSVQHKVTDLVPYDTGFKPDDLHRWLSDAGLVDIQIKSGCYTVDFYIPSEDRKVPFKFLIAGGRRRT